MSGKAGESSESQLFNCQCVRLPSWGKKNSTLGFSSRFVSEWHLHTLLLYLAWSHHEVLSFLCDKHIRSSLQAERSFVLQLILLK
jgi:hypothetical protein